MPPVLNVLRYPTIRAVLLKEMNDVVRSCVLEVISSILSRKTYFFSVRSQTVLFSEFQEECEKITNVSIPVFFSFTLRNCSVI